MPLPGETRARHDRAAVAVGRVHQFRLAFNSRVGADRVQNQRVNEQSAQLNPAAAERFDPPLDRRHGLRGDEAKEPGTRDRRDHHSNDFDDGYHALIVAGPAHFSRWLAQFSATLYMFVPAQLFSSSSRVATELMLHTAVLDQQLSDFLNTSGIVLFYFVV